MKHLIAVLACGALACGDGAPAGTSRPSDPPDETIDGGSTRTKDGSAPRPDGGAETEGGAPATKTLDPTSGKYRQACDGSGGVAIDFTHFLDVNDENQGVRIYERAKDGAPVKELDVSTALGLGVTGEADLEDAARVGDRVYVISSHGRNKSGDLIDDRYRFFALDLTGALPDLKVTVAGSYSKLMKDLLVSANWTTPNATVIAALDTASKLGDNSDSNLAPEKNGTNIEGLAALPGGRLAIGFRNPRPGGPAIVVTLTNADAVISGTTAHFGEAIQLDLGGLGVRGMAWSEAHAAMLVLGGAAGGTGPFKLFKWSGAAGAAATLVKEITPPTDGSAEAVIAYPGTKDVQILFDQGDGAIGGGTCKDAAAAERVFTDTIVHVD